LTDRIGDEPGSGTRTTTAVREALEAAAERHHHPGASDGGDGGGGAGERTGQRRGPRGDLRALPRLNGL
jgi:hypothetical protein